MVSGYHNRNELLEAVSDFERVVRSSEDLCKGGKRLARLLSVYFAMRSAFSIRAILGLRDDCLAEAMDEAGMDWGVEEESLPTLDAVRSATQRLFAAVASNNKVATVSALEEMGVLSLCPIPDEQLSRMERLAAHVAGRARLVFLVDLSLFSVELGDFDAARKYVTEAWGLDPSAWELYNLYMLEGLFALNAGEIDEAVRYLDRSLNACQIDEHASLNCGIRAPSFLLARKLFERGELSAVLKHLLDCKNVWQFSRMPMSNWIDLIECGKTPDFEDSEIVNGMNQPSYQLDMQWMRARSLEATKGPGPPSPIPQSPAEVVTARKKLLEDSSRRINAMVRERIEYLDE